MILHGSGNLVDEMPPGAVTRVDLLMTAAAMQGYTHDMGGTYEQCRPFMAHFEDDNTVMIGIKFVDDDGNYHLLMIGEIDPDDLTDEEAGIAERISDYLRSMMLMRQVGSLGDDWEEPEAE